MTFACHGWDLINTLILVGHAYMPASNPRRPGYTALLHPDAETERLSEFAGKSGLHEVGVNGRMSLQFAFNTVAVERKSFVFDC